jgi:hypothetical protein
MSRAKMILALSLFVMLSLACNITSSSNPTQETSATQPIISMPTNQTGIPYSKDNINLIIPEGLAAGASAKTTIDVEYPYINPSSGDMPSHTVIQLDGYILPRSARILVFKAVDFAGYTSKTGEIISTLQNLPLDAGQPFPEALTTTFYAQSISLNSTTTHGIRYLTQVMDAFVTINNEDLFYYYQGLTNDGQFYIEAILPINSEMLPLNNSMDAVLPPEGIPFPFDKLGDNDARNAYYDAVRNKLNATAQSDFQPALDVLDSLVKSISIRP